MTVNNALETTTVINNIYNDVEPATFVNEKVVTELLNELREQIAKEIESLEWDFSGYIGGEKTVQQLVMPQVRDRCAAIARGQK